MWVMECVPCSARCCTSGCTNISLKLSWATSRTPLRQSIRQGQGDLPSWYKTCQRKIILSPHTSTHLFRMQVSGDKNEDCALAHTSEINVENSALFTIPFALKKLDVHAGTSHMHRHQRHGQVMFTLSFLYIFTWNIQSEPPQWNQNFCYFFWWHTQRKSVNLIKIRAVEEHRTLNLSKEVIIHFLVEF